MTRYLFSAFYFVLLILIAPAGYSAQNLIAPQLSINGIEDFIQTNHIQSLEELLPYFPKSYLTYYALVFNSRSLQSSSFAYPRALVFGSNAKLIMTFNGSPEESGFNALELLEFNELSKSFQLEEILFSPKNEKNETSTVSFSQKNPEKCIKCHGAIPHPLWDSPPLWPGSYGEAYHEKLSKTESEGLYTYLRQQPTHRRYQYLTNTQIYQDDATFYSTHHDVYNGINIESPNAQLSKLLSALNNEKIIQQLIVHPKFAQYRYALLASVSSNCTSTLNFFPDSWRQKLDADYLTFSDQDKIYLQRQMIRKSQRSIADKDKNSFVNKDNSLRDLRYIAERGLGIDTSEWSMALEINSPDFSTLEPIKSLIEKKLLAHIQTKDREIMNAFYFKDYPGNNRYCSYLEKQSRHQLKELEITQSLIFSKKNESVIEHRQVSQLIDICANCHTTGVAPPIEFHHIETLSVRLNLPYSVRGTLLNEILFRLSPQAGSQRMPPTVNFSDAELMSLENYFNYLAAHH